MGNYSNHIGLSSSEAPSIFFIFFLRDFIFKKTENIGSYSNHIGLSSSEGPSIFFFFFWGTLFSRKLKIWVVIQITSAFYQVRLLQFFFFFFEGLYLKTENMGSYSNHIGLSSSEAPSIFFFFFWGTLFSRKLKIWVFKSHRPFIKWGSFNFFFFWGTLFENWKYG